MSRCDEQLVSRIDKTMRPLLLEEELFSLGKGVSPHGPPEGLVGADAELVGVEAH